MSPDHEKYQAASRRAEATRERFFADLAATRDRVRPARLKADAQAGVAKAATLAGAKAVGVVKARPFTFGAILASLIAIILRKPLTALSRSLLVSGRRAWHARMDRRSNDERE